MARPGFLNHRKFKKLVAITKLPRPYALGLMEMIWSSCYENGEPFLGEHASDVEHIAEWPGKAGELSLALVQCGFIDKTPEGFFVHDLHDHAPSYVKDRAKRESDRRSDQLCRGCGKFFRPNRPNQKHCSSTCRKNAYRNSATDLGKKSVAKSVAESVADCDGLRRFATDCGALERIATDCDAFGQKLDDFNNYANQDPVMVSDESATLCDALRRIATDCDATPAPAPLKKEILTAHTVFCMGDAFPEVPAEKESVCVPFSNSKSDPLKASESARKIVDLYREKINPRSLPRMGEREVFELLTGAIEVDPAVLVRSVENFAKFRIRMGPNPPYAPHASKFFRDRLWEAYADGVPDFAPIASNATPEALKTKSTDLEKMLQDTKEVSARRTTNTKA